MPQMDPTWFASQLFWLAVTFVFLYLALASHVLPRIHNILEGRKDRIDHDLGRASQMKEEAQEARTTYEKALTEARMGAQELLAANNKTAAAQAAAQNAELDKVITAKLSESEASIAKARADVMVKIEPIAQELASLIVEKLVNFKPTDDKIAGVIGAKKRA